MYSSTLFLKAIYSQVSTLLLNDSETYGKLVIQKPRVYSIDWTEASSSRCTKQIESTESGEYYPIFTILLS
jgi:hypothetical protein